MGHPVRMSGQSFPDLLFPCQAECGDQDSSPWYQEVMPVIIREETAGNEPSPLTVM